MDETSKNDFSEDIAEEYAELREEHYESLKVDQSLADFIYLIPFTGTQVCYHRNCL